MLIRDAIRATGGLSHSDKKGGQIQLIRDGRLTRIWLYELNDGPRRAEPAYVEPGDIIDVRQSP